MSGTSNNNPHTQGAVHIDVGTAPKTRMPKKKGQKKGKKKTAISKKEKVLENQVRNLSAKVAGMKVSAPQRMLTKLEQRIMDYCTCDGVIIPKRYEYLAALVAPREAEDIRLPDPWTRERTATYQTKYTFNIMGVQPATGSGAGSGAVFGNDIGRFAIVLNPVFDTASAAFNVTSPNSLFYIQDGVASANTQQWVRYWQVNSPTGNLVSYQQDPNQTQLANLSSPGFMRRTRPVSASILATYNGQLINGGGNIAAAYVPGDWWALSGTNSSLGPCNWETTALIKGAYDGPLDKGAYVIWTPEDETDTLLRDVNQNSPDRMANHDYPMLTVTGQVTSPTAGFNGSSQLRIDIYVNWEYTTDNRIIPTSHGSKDMNERLLAYKILAKESLSMENTSHIDWIKTILGGILGFAARGTLVGAALGASAGAGISLASSLGAK